MPYTTKICSCKNMIRLNLILTNKANMLLKVKTSTWMIGCLVLISTVKSFQVFEGDDWTGESFQPTVPQRQLAHPATSEFPVNSKKRKP